MVLAITVFFLAFLSTTVAKDHDSFKNFAAEVYEYSHRAVPVPDMVNLCN